MEQYGLTWPLASIDFEASSLVRNGSYPIEVGLAIWRSPKAPIVTWSSLIYPDPDWVKNGIWLDEAQKIHGIAPCDLEEAPSATWVAHELNKRMAGCSLAMCDGGEWDEHWYLTLFAAASVRPQFRLCSLREGLEKAGPDLLNKFADISSKKIVPHRAGPDAEIHLASLFEALDR